MDKKGKKVDDKKIKPNNFILLIWGILSSWAEAHIAFVTINEPNSTNTVLLYHTTIVIVLIIITAINYKRDRDINLYATLVLLTAFIGLFGSVTATVVIVRYMLYSRDAESFSDWLESLFPEENHKESHKLAERIKFGLNNKDEEYVESYYDLMAYGSTTDKQTLIARATRYFTPTMAPILILALQDENNIIRVQAAASIAKIENNLFSSYNEYEKVLDTDPHSYQHNLKYSISCIDYMQSGILGPKRTQEIGFQTVKILKKCIELSPADNTPQFLIGKVYIILDEVEKAYIITKKIIKEADFIIPDLIQIYLICLYKLGKYSKLRSFSSDYISGKINNLIVDDEINAQLEVWSSCTIQPEWSC